MERTPFDVNLLLINIDKDAVDWLIVNIRINQSFSTFRLIFLRSFSDIVKCRGNLIEIFCTVSLINSKAKLAAEGEKKIKKSLKFEHQTVHIR